MAKLWTALHAARRGASLDAAALLLLVLAIAPSAAAQSWSGSGQTPALFHIVAIDGSGERDFAYRREDVAGDGLAMYAEDEAGSDLRSVYADAAPARLWLRAYLASTGAPAATLRAFFFIDQDARETTGGPAQGVELEEALTDDPTRGGYERAVAVSGEGTVLGVFDWNAAMRRWAENTSYRPPDVSVEAGTDDDPLELASLQHTYLQISLAHSLSGLSQSCGGTLFVRLLNELSPTRTLADDAPDAFACKTGKDGYGDPVILQPPDGCSGDAQCPGGGVCREDVCLIVYACTEDSACPSGYRCDANACVKVVSGSCDDAADCSGLVCEASRCVACSASGARACASGRLCAPDGTCRNPDALGEPSGGGNGGGNGGEDVPGKVRGGAFSCASAAMRGSARAWLLVLLALPVLAHRRRRRHARARGRRAQEGTP